MTQALPALDAAQRAARAFLESLPSRHVGATATLAELREAFGGALPETGEAPEAVVEGLVRAAEGGLVATAGPRYFGFVIGGSVPAALAADWLCSAWDQNAGLYVGSPAATVAEEVAAAWVLDLLDLPREASVGLVTGCQMANFTCLAAARHEVLRRAGWDVEEQGLSGAPPVHVVAGADCHVTILTSARMLGLGAGRLKRVEADDQGRMKPAALREVLKSCDGPTIVCAQAGDVNTGAFDPFEAIADAAAGHGQPAWLHVDGAFGLWARASRGLRGQTAGLERADSWATDAHKWLNVPYDSGLAIVRHREAHRGAMASTAAYYVMGDGMRREPHEYVPEASRRARGFALYAALRSLGRGGVEELIDRCCALARRMADRLREAPGVRIVNDVMLNQVLVSLDPPAGVARDAFTRAVLERVQSGGVCWLGGTTWEGCGC
jgi:glutamate/tyrosine decarboxylase-like PLP-dependent enzyme